MAESSIILSKLNCSQFQLGEFGSKFVEFGSSYSLTLDQDPGFPVNPDPDPKSGSRFLITLPKDITDSRKSLFYGNGNIHISSKLL